MSRIPVSRPRTEIHISDRFGIAKNKSPFPGIQNLSSFQTGPGTMKYSTFRHPPPSMSPPIASSSNNNSSKPQMPIYAMSTKATSAIHQPPHPLASTNTVSSLGGDSAGNSKSSSQVRKAAAEIPERRVQSADSKLGGEKGG